MILFAEIDAAGWTAIIGAFFLGFTTLAVQLTMLILGYLREQSKLEREKAAAKKVDAVAEKVATVADNAEAAVDKADASHAIVLEIKDLAVKTENQTNNRLSELDKKVADHERRCIENMRIIAELKLALAEALKRP